MNRPGNKKLAEKAFDFESGAFKSKNLDFDSKEDNLLPENVYSKSGKIFSSCLDFGRALILMFSAYLFDFFKATITVYKLNFAVFSCCYA